MIIDRSIETRIKFVNKSDLKLLHSSSYDIRVWAEHGQTYLCFALTCRFSSTTSF